MNDVSETFLIASPHRNTAPTVKRAVEVAVVVPTYNEAANVLVLTGKLHDVLDSRCRWEMIVVDDNSTDGTALAVEAASQQGEPIRCIRRIGRRGLRRP